VRASARASVPDAREVAMRRSLALTSAVLLVALSCTPSSAPPAGSADTPVSGGRIVAASVDDIKTLNPVLSSDVPSFNAWSLMYLPLTRANADNAETEPYVAQKFELSADSLTMTYTLRDGVVWSDGVPFTGDDYKYTAEAVMRSRRGRPTPSPASPSAIVARRSRSSSRNPSAPRCRRWAAPARAGSSRSTAS
jgi:peptide/nickel transport system substrate-binding protein